MQWNRIILLLYNEYKKCIVKYAQKNLKNLVMFGHTYYWLNVIIINVKTPQYIIYFLLHPIISEIPSPKRTAFPGCPFYFIGIGN